SFCSGLAGPGPADRPSACRAPLSRWSRQALISEVYRPSRRSSAPLASRSHSSCSARTSRLYFAVYVRRLAFSGTCGSGTSSFMDPVCPALCGGVIVVFIRGELLPALYDTDPELPGALLKVDTEGGSLSV